MAFSNCLLFLLPLGFSIFLLGTLAQDPSEFISLTCGSPRETSFREKIRNIKYISDAAFINTGVGRSIKPSFRTQSQQQTWYLRSFPQGNRSCYTLNLITGDRYLIRTSFFHGGYDDKPSTQFDLHLGPNLWTRVSTTNETKQETFEMIHLLTTDRLQVCLVKTGDSTPFISALELRKLDSKAYNGTQNVSLQTFIRLDVGSISKKPLRYGADVYGADVFDRIWLPYNSENWSQISTNNSVDINNFYKPPEAAMVTACVPTDPDASMNISLTGVHQFNSKFYAVFHFAEIEELNSNDTREFNIFYSGRYISRHVMPTSFYTYSYFLDEEMGPNAKGEYTISLKRTRDSTMPPLLNALEVYLIKSLTQQTTETREVNAITNIKSGYGLNKLNWEGDPCAPKNYMWVGVNCNLIHDKPPQIISLNLTASGLIGEILDSISNLTSLQVLDLSNNNLTGSVPEFLANMDTLKLINLSSNELNGSIPASLLDKAQRGKVVLSVEANPGLCPSPSCATTTTKKKKKTIVVASTATTLVLMLIITATILVILKRKKRATRSHHHDSDNNNNQSSDNMFTYEVLANATDNFSNTNLIGQGGFGYVHRGLLPDETEVAIKQLKAGSGKGEQEFQAEINIITRVHHRHLLSMIGYCITGSQRLLVYEFVPNKNLEFHLHEKGRPVMEWPKRMKIALGVAKGLSYLHEDCNPKTIHRDVKAANILIDDSYEAKLADFGLARCSLDTDTHISTRVVGTFGYLAPEYASSGNLTDKSDVYSFGVVLLELITGRRPIDISQASVDEYSVVDWAKPLMIQALHDGSFEGLVDPRLDNEFDTSEMKRMFACAAASAHYSAKRRPKMSQIFRAFEGNLSLDDITQGVTPERSTIYSLDGSSGYSSTQYTNDLKKFKKIALESQTFGSSGLTSDNGHYVSGSSTTTDDAIGQRTMHEIEPEKNTDETRASNRGFLV